jgi:hypothetical protein
MAKRRSTALAHYSPPRPQLVVIKGGSGGKRRRSGGRAIGRRARRAGRHVVKHGLPLTGLALGGALTGYAVGEGWLDRVPELGGSKMLGLAAIAYIATRVTKNKYVREAAAATVAVAAFEFGREHGGGSAGGGGGAGGKHAATHGWSGGGLGPFGGG